MKSMVHSSVRHVYLCENRPSPGKVKHSHLDCVKRMQMTDVETNQTKVCFCCRREKADGNNCLTGNKLRGTQPCWW